MLLLWKLRLGDKATYRKLIDVFERTGHQDYADFVSKIFGNDLLLNFLKAIVVIMCMLVLLVKGYKICVYLLH